MFTLIFQTIIIISPTERDGRLCFSRCRYVCLWTTFWLQFKSDCHQTWSVIPLATGDEVIKFWKVKVKGHGRWEGMRPTERPSSCLYVVIRRRSGLKGYVLILINASNKLALSTVCAVIVPSDWRGTHLLQASSTGRSHQCPKLTP